MAATGFPELNVPADPTAYIGRNVALSQALEQQRQLLPLQIQQQQIAAREAQYQWEATQAINQAYQQAYTNNPQTGVPTFDFDKLQQALALSGHGSAIPGAMDAFSKWQQNVLGLQETRTKLQTAESNALGQLGYAVSKANNDPNLLLHGLQSVYPMYPQVGPYIQALQRDPSITPALTEWMMNLSPEAVKARQEDIKAKASGLKEVGGGLYDVSTGQMVQTAGMGMMPLDAATAQAAGIPAMAGYMFPAKTIKEMKDAVAAGITFQNYSGSIWKINKATGAPPERMGASPTIVNLNTLYGMPGQPGGPGGTPAYQPTPNLQPPGTQTPMPGGAPGAAQTPVPGAAPSAPPSAGGPPPPAVETPPSGNLYAPSATPAPGETSRFPGNPTANVPLIQRKDATDKALAAGSDYNRIKSANDDMQTVINLARSGNVVAYRYAPDTGVLTINTSVGKTTRVNTGELRDYGGAGSTWDRFVGWLGGHVSGASIAPNVLNDMSELHTAIENNAFTKYSNDLDLINSSYGSTFRPIPLKTPTGAVPGASARPAPGGAPTARPAGGGAQLRGPVQPGERVQYSRDGRSVVLRGGQWVDPTTGLPPTR